MKELIEAGSLPWPALREVPSPGGLTVRRAREGRAGKFEWWMAAKDRHVKVKVIAVDISALPVVKTTQRLEVWTDTADGPSELISTWQAEWRMEEKEGDPVLTPVRQSCTEAEETRAKTKWLTDLTGSVLSPLPVVRDQLAHGNNYHLARIQKYLEFHLFGHHGLAVGDANGDGLDDVYLCQGGGLPNLLLVQNADGTLRDSSREAGVDFLESTRSALFADLDNDGDQDLIVAVSHSVLLLENDGAGRFSARARLPRVNDAFSLAAADYDGDGFLDFYICGYQAREADASRLPVPAPYFDARNGGENFLIHNDGKWTFANATADTGLDVENNRFSFAATWVDADLDGLPDLLVANDFGVVNFYRQSRGTDGKPYFTDIAAQRGLALSAFGMSVTAGDPNRDGRTDLYTANMFSSAGSRITLQPEFKPAVTAEIRSRFRHLSQGNCLLTQGADGSFTDEAQAANVAMGRWSWGSLFADLNSDGLQDLLVANGYVSGRGKDPDL